MTSIQVPVRRRAVRPPLFIPAILVCLFSGLFFATGAGAALWERSWQDQGSSQDVQIDTQFLLLKDLHLSPFQQAPSVPCRLRFHASGGLPRLLVGEKESVYVFVFVSTAEYEGVTYCVTTRVLCIPPKGAQPSVWVPRGFKKKNSFIPEEDPRRELKRIGLLPADGEFDFWYRKEQKPVSLRKLLDDLSGGYVFPFDIDLAGVRPEGYEIPSTIDANSLSVRIGQDGTLRLSFRDTALSGTARDRVFYRFDVYRRAGFGGFYHYRPIGGSIAPASAGTLQEIDIPMNAPYLDEAFQWNDFYRVDLRVVRQSYGDVPSSTVGRAFVFIRGGFFDR